MTTGLGPTTPGTQETFDFLYQHALDWWEYANPSASDADLVATGMAYAGWFANEYFQEEDRDWGVHPSAFLYWIQYVHNA